MNSPRPSALPSPLLIVLDPSPLRGVVLRAAMMGWANSGPHDVFIPIHVLEALADGDAGVDATDLQAAALAQNGWANDTSQDRHYGSLTPTPSFLARWAASQDEIYPPGAAA